MPPEICRGVTLAQTDGAIGLLQEDILEVACAQILVRDGHLSDADAKGNCNPPVVVSSRDRHATACALIALHTKCRCPFLGHGLGSR
jgi:hypothetical protein